VGWSVAATHSHNICPAGSAMSSDFTFAVPQPPPPPQQRKEVRRDGPCSCGAAALRSLQPCRPSPTPPSPPQPLTARSTVSHAGGGGGRAPVVAAPVVRVACRLSPAPLLGLAWCLGVLAGTSLTRSPPPCRPRPFRRARRGTRCVRACAAAMLPWLGQHASAELRCARLRACMHAHLLHAWAVRGQGGRPTCHACRETRS